MHILSPFPHTSCIYLCKHLLIGKTQLGCKQMCVCVCGRRNEDTKTAGSSRWHSMINFHGTLGEGGERGIFRCTGGWDFFPSYIHEAFFFYFPTYSKTERDITVQFNFKFYSQDPLNNSSSQIPTPA